MSLLAVDPFDERQNVGAGNRSIEKHDVSVAIGRDLLRERKGITNIRRHPPKAPRYAIFFVDQERSVDRVTKHQLPPRIESAIRFAKSLTSAAELLLV